MEREAAIRPAIQRWVKEAHRVDLLYAGVAIVSTASFLLLTAMVFEGFTATIDRNWIVALRTFASPSLTRAMLAVTFTTGRLAILVAIVFAYLFYRRDGWRTAWYYVAACITAQLLNLVLKYDLRRARPHGISPKLTLAGGPSYPSADVMLAVLVFGLGTLILSRSVESRGARVTMRTVAGLFIIASAFARVYLGAHWPTDVIAGLLAGVACSAAWAAGALSGRRPIIGAPDISTN